MPTYSFREITTGNPREVFFTYSEFDTKITAGGVCLDPEDGCALIRDCASDWARQGTTQSSCWPMVSDSMGVSETQIEEAEQHSIKEGVPTHFNELGQAVFNSQSHYKKYAEKYRFFAKNGGYSDPQRR